MDKTCVVSCGGDPLVKLWTHGDDGLTHAKTLPIEGEECLAVAFARDARGPEGRRRLRRDDRSLCSRAVCGYFQVQGVALRPFAAVFMCRWFV